MYSTSNECNCGNSFAALNNYNSGSARVFQNSGQSQPVILSNFGSYGYSNMESAPKDTSQILGYATLGTTYSNQPVPAAQGGYQLLSGAYKQVNLFSSPYSSRQCMH